MKKANATNRVLIGLTALFMLIAAFSFVAFHETEELCPQAKTCTKPAESRKGGEMLWDGFSRRFVSFVTIK